MPITEAKEIVPTMRLVEREAAAQGKEIIPSGDRSKLLCLFSDHQEKTASFTVYPDGGWRCFGCQRGGDVVELARVLWDFPNSGRGAAMAAAELLLSFGHQPPQRPPSYFRRQERQQPARDLMDRELFAHFHRRVFRRFFYPLVEAIEDRDERNAEAEHLWDAAEMLTRLMAERMMGRER